MTELFAVIVGFLIAKGWDYFGSRSERGKKRKLLLEELDTNLRMIPQKIGTTQNILDVFARNQVFPGGGVSHFTSTFYRSYYYQVADEISLLERNSLVMIHEYLRQIDQYFDSYAEGIFLATDTERVDLEIKKARGIVTDLQTQLYVTADLIQKHLKGCPDDVLYATVSIEQLMKNKFQTLRPDPRRADIHYQHAQKDK